MERNQILLTSNQRIAIFLPFALSCFLIPIFCSPHTVCYAQETVSSAGLTRNTPEYDGKEIIYEGEVIGEVMKRRDGVWVNINDGENVVGVWMPPGSADIIGYAGNYKARGDTLRVMGRFNRVCSVHGGDLDIHAASVQKLKSGWQVQENIIPAKRNLLIILSVILCLVLILRILIVR